MPDELRAMIDRLRERRNALRGGDGFGNAGTLIGAYKKTIAKMEELVTLVETLPLTDSSPQDEKSNPDCFGNLPGCECRKVFDATYRNN